MYLQKGLNPKTIIVALLFIISLGILANSYNKMQTQNDYINLFKSHDDGINHVSQLNAKWFVAIDKLKGLALIDFDEIASYTKRIRAKIADLDDLGLTDDDLVGEETTYAYQQFKNKFEVKYEAIQRYKSEIAVLRNSANYIEASANEAITNLKSQKLIENTKITTSSLVKYLSLNNNYWEEDSKKNLSYLESQDIRSENTLGKDVLASYIKHAKIILEYGPRVSDMLETAKTINIFLLTQNISQTLLSRQNKSNDVINYWKKIMIGAAVVSMLVFLWLVSILSKRPRRPVQANPRTA